MCFQEVKTKKASYSCLMSGSITPHLLISYKYTDPGEDQYCNFTSTYRGRARGKVRKDLSRTLMAMLASLKGIDWNSNSKRKDLGWISCKERGNLSQASLYNVLN